jgi:hypothetical protein
MSRSFGGWAPYVPVAARRRKAEREMEKLRKKGAVLSSVKIEGRQIARTFWGKAWCDNLESYRDYENRLPQGRTYVRNGSVVDLQIAPREVTAIVSGSKIYKVKVSIGNHFRSHDPPGRTAHDRPSRQENRTSYPARLPQLPGDEHHRLSAQWWPPRVRAKDGGA